MTNEQMNEFDRWLAVEIMKWRACCSMAGTGAYTDYQTFIMKEKDWHPTRNIAQAFEVVEKIAKAYVMDLLLVKTVLGAWRCEIWIKDSDYQKTKELAICLAAKKVWEAK